MTSCHSATTPYTGNKLCPFSLALFLASATAYAVYTKRKEETANSDRQRSPTTEVASCQVVFVLGGPGAGYVLRTIHHAENSLWFILH